MSRFKAEAETDSEKKKGLYLPGIWYAFHDFQQH